MLLHALSLGREVDVWRPRTGIVHSVYEQAVNLLVDGEMWTLLAAAKQDAPFGVRLAHGSLGFDLKVADRVSVRAGFARAGKLIVDCRSASRWAPAHWAQPTDGFAARLSAVKHAARPRAWNESARMAGDVMDALHRSDAELAAAVARTVGRGPGLTPSGDDVLVGILALLTSGAAGQAGVAATHRLVGALLPFLPTTPDISRHLLHQAARGLTGRALHDLGKALVEGAAHDVLAEALDSVFDTGCTSGADACMGLTAACRFFFLKTERLAA